ncbi:hypothetical protein HYT24_02790 [Candidatus Pacearchaeota archaeon]|nr:hypothetical protein [Candidatus Pacearchaeota archaeon]
MAQEKRKKKFFDVEIPLVSQETQLQAYEIGELDGRIINYDLTRTLKGKSMLLQLQVKMEDGKPMTKAIQIKLLPYFLRRMVRKGTNYVEDSFTTETKDGKITVKPFMVTRRKVSRAIRKALREKAREDLSNYFKNKNSEEIFDETIRGTIQKQLNTSLKKIYPLSLCEIRVLKVEKKNTHS